MSSPRMCNSKMLFLQELSEHIFYLLHYINCILVYKYSLVNGMRLLYYNIYLYFYISALIFNLLNPEKK